MPALRYLLDEARDNVAYCRGRVLCRLAGLHGLTCAGRVDHARRYRISPTLRRWSW